MDLALLLRFVDINVLQRSHLFAQLASGDAPACNYTVNGYDHTMGIIFLTISILLDQLL